MEPELIEEYRCKRCGCYITEDQSDDNNQLCDNCYNETHLNQGYIYLFEE